MNIAVTGGTGFVGSHLVNRLVEGQHSVRLLVRRDISPKLINDNVNYFSGAIDDVEGMTTAFDGAEVVCHLVGIIAETPKVTFESVIAQGTRNVIAACKRAGVQRVIYLSALGTSEDAPSRYHQAKYLAEQTVISSGLAYTILRPSVIYGRGDGLVSKLCQMIRYLPLTPVIGDGRYCMQPVYIEDMTEALARSLSLPDCEGKIIDIAGPEVLEYIEILDIIKSVLGKKRLNIYLPTGVVKIVAGIMEKILRPAPITVDQLTMMKMGNTGNIHQMKMLLGLEPVRMATALSRYLR